MLINEGFTRTKDIDESQIVIINTCAVNSEIENRTISYLEGLKTRYPDKQIVTSGCFPAIQPEKFNSNFNFPFVSPQNIGKLKTILNISSLDESLMETSFDSNHHGASHHVFFSKIRSISKNQIIQKFLTTKMINLIHGIVYNPTFHILPIGKGCMGDCTYCAIKFARGRAKSRSIAEIKRSLPESNNNIWLLSGDVGCWGIDFNMNVSSLLAELFKSSNLNLVINYFGPEWLVKFNELIFPYFSDNRLTYVGIPIQSGSNKVIKEAKRNYDINEVLAIIRKIKLKNPNLIIKTDIIVGLPGETWNDFIKTCRAIFSFHTVYAQKYSKHSRTSASKNTDQVSPIAISTRLLIIKTLITIRHFVTIFSCLLPSLRSKEEK